MHDIKGFDWIGYPWSWPEFYSSGSVLRPAHAHLGKEGWTACGQPWPYRLGPGRMRGGGVYTYAPIPAPEDHVPLMVPSPANRARVAAAPGDFLCDDCLAILGTRD